MKDSRKKTIVEVATGKVLSFVSGYFINMLVLPMVGVSVDDHGAFLGVSLIFVLVASVRSYAWRRLFNYLDPKFLR